MKNAPTARVTRFWASKAAISSSALSASASARIRFVTASSWLGGRPPRRREQRLGGGRRARRAASAATASQSTAGLASSTAWPSSSSTPAGALRRRGHLGIDRRARPRRVVTRDAQPAGIGAELGGVRPLRRRRGVLVADARARARRRAARRRRGRVRREREVLAQPEQRLARCPGPHGVRPRLGLSPTSPQHEAGIRIEPAPSLPWAIGTAPAATSAADAAAGAADAALEIPRVAGRPGPQRLGGEADRQLRARWSARA